MRHILSRSNKALLQTFSKRKVLLAFDFDGTLAPIVSNRDAALMRRQTLRLFRRLCQIYPCAIITGRKKSDVIDRLEDASVQYIVGNHGLEMEAPLSAFRSEMRPIRTQLLRSFRGNDDIELEDKVYSLSVHFNGSRSKKRTLSQIVQAISALRAPVRIVHGKDVVNVVSKKAPHKGHALTHLYRLAQAEGALYVGDDTTDEDVFQLRGLKNLLCVRVGRSKSSGASFFLSRQHEIDPLLQTLIDGRSQAAFEE